MKAFILSFGDSDKYIVPFDGTREEFEKSEELKHIEDRLYDSIKEKFPGKLCKNLLQPKIEDYDTIREPIQCSTTTISKNSKTIWSDRWR